MNEIIALVRRLLGLEPSVAKIMSPITKIANKLEAHSIAQEAAAFKAEAEAEAKRALAAAKRTEANLAQSFKKTLPSF